MSTRARPSGYRSASRCAKPWRATACRWSTSRGSISSRARSARWRRQCVSPGMGTRCPRPRCSRSPKNAASGADLGDWLLRSACAQTARWHAQGFTALRVSVNLSARQFALCGLQEAIESVLMDAGLPPTGLDLGLTEHVLMEDMDRLVDCLQAFSAAPRHPVVPRRFRHRQFQPRQPAAAADRRAQDRRLVPRWRARTGRRRGGAGIHRHDGAQPGHARRRGRGQNRKDSANTCRATCATRSREASCPDRYRPKR